MRRRESQTKMTEQADANRLDDPPQVADEGGYLPAIKAFRKPDETGEMETWAIALGGGGGEEPDSWARGLASLANGIGEVFARGSDRPEAASVVASGIMLQALNNLLREAGPHTIYSTVALLGALVRTYGDEGEANHPGALELPDVVEEPDALQALTLWTIPAHECPSCDEVHPTEIEFTIEPPILTTVEWGETLADILYDAAEGLAYAEGRPFEECYSEITQAFQQRAAAAFNPTGRQDA